MSRYVSRYARSGGLFNGFRSFFESVSRYWSIESSNRACIQLILKGLEINRFGYATASSKTRYATRTFNKSLWIVVLGACRSSEPRKRVISFGQCGNPYITRWSQGRVHAVEGAVARTALCCGEPMVASEAPPPPWGVADRRRQTMRLGTRDQAIPQAVRPPEGRAGILPPVPVFRNAPESV